MKKQPDTFLFFDTETTGLPRKFTAPITDSDNWPRTVQIAWAIYDNPGVELKNRDYIIKPEGFTIPKEATRIHGISTKRAEEEGVPLKEVLIELLEDIRTTGTLVAHNLRFDKNIIEAELFRKEIEFSFEFTGICTMLDSKNFCKIQSRRGYKWPKLQELYTILFNEEFEDAHNALVDVKACAKCFFRLREIGGLK